MQIITIPFEQLKISKFNMRVNEKKPDIDHILPSVREKGILMPLIVRPEDGIYGVVAGRTRWFCVNAILQEGGNPGSIPCCEIAEGDDAAALEASIIENYARKNPLDCARKTVLIVPYADTVHSAFDSLFWQTTGGPAREAEPLLRAA